MKFSCIRASLAQAVAAVERAVANNTAEPLLSGILIEALEDRLRLVATDRELGIEYFLPAEVNTPGIAVVDARYFSQIVRKLDSESFSYDSGDEQASATIRGGSARFTLHTMPAEDFPALPEVTSGEMWRVPQSTLRTMIRQTVFAAANDEARPFLSGVFFEIEGNTLRLVSTDASRLAYRTASLQAPASMRAHAIVPTRVLRELVRLLDPDDQTPAQFATASNQILFLLPGVRVVSNLIEGQFPNYRAVLPKDQTTKIVIPRTEFIAAVERAALVTRNESAVVVLTVNDGTLAVSAQDAEIGRAYEELSVKQEGSDGQVGFDPNYLLDMLRVTETESVQLALTDSNRPGSLSPIEGEDYLYVVMPKLLV